ncbi:hypothetical protein LTR27_009598 [Elasticomyces elasticus]|nr:hypothetical protein LTR27_009598 [Elasticomyces elasticus]
MTSNQQGFVFQQLCIEFAALKHACPKGVYIAPVPEEPLRWTGVLFPRKGPYASAVLRFQIDFPVDYPERPPVITFLCDVFHPLVTPWTTYTHTTRDTGADTVSSADEGRLPPGGLTLRHGFPEWHDERKRVRDFTKSNGRRHASWPHVVEVLHYLRVVFESVEVLDSAPLEYAANSGAWHAWRSYRSKTAPNTRFSPEAGEAGLATTRQPGGARQPGQWNWQGVWQDRVKKSIQASKSDLALFSANDDSVINFQQPGPPMDSS